MPNRLSSILNVTEEALDQKGVFNSFVDIDSKLYLDPALLGSIKIPEFMFSQKKYRAYFENVLKLLVASKSSNDTMWRKALKMVHFKEFQPVALGYSDGHKGGNAIGPTLANNLLKTVSEIIDAGITDPIIFELVGLLEEGIGADRISDMTIHIIKQDLIAYTQRVCKELKISVTNFRGTELPSNGGEPIVFVPKHLLRDLPVAFDWDDIDRVCSENEALRSKVNNDIGNTWKYATTKVSKKGLKNTLIDNPELLKDLIKSYHQKPKIPYDFKRDSAGEVIWASISEKATKDYPISFANSGSITDKEILPVVEKICDQFAQLIENNGLWEFLYNDQGKLRHERFAQKLFYE